MPVNPDSAARRAEDLALVRQVLSGDQLALARFSERMKCIPRFLSSANSRLGAPLNREDLADLSQDTLILVWRKLETFEARATLESWTWRFCQLELSNRARKRYRRKAVTGASLDSLAEEEAVAEETPALDYDYLERALEALGPPGEEIIRMKHFEHLMFSEIADRMEISINTVKTRYYRGMTWLKGHLASAEDQL